jgi:hypothetical protein
MSVQFTQEGSEEQGLIDIDHPAPEPEPEAASTKRTPTPEPTTTEADNRSGSSDTVLKNGDEWSSPAFIKRARTSYGSLFDTGYDPFAEEDGTIPGKGRKRSRLSTTWRYVSRSPSPSPIPKPAQEPAHASPPPVSEPATADKGQTAGLEVGDAAETLAHFSRQATTASHAFQNAEAPMLAKGDQYDASQNEIPPRAPEQPHFTPTSSEALPLASPVSASKPSSFKHGEDSSGQLEQVVDGQPAKAVEIPPASHVEVFQTGPIDHHGAPHVPEFQNFHDAAMSVPGIEHNDFLSNGQYSQWEAVNPQLGPSLSQEELHPEDFYDAEEEPDNEGQKYEEEHEANGFPISQSEALSYQQYPPLDDELHGQEIHSPWALSSATVAYPDLPDPEQEVGHAVDNISHPPSTGASHVQSTQPAIVDITESDEDGEEQAPSEGSVDDEGSEGSSQVSLYDESLRSRMFPNGEAYMGDGEQDERNMPGEDFEDDYPYSRRYDGDSDEEGDEEDYDEDFMDDNVPQGRSTQAEPVVIDLLSSDDEDAADKSIPASQPTRSPPQQPKALTESVSSEEDESEPEEEYDEGELDSVRDQISTIAPQEDSEESAEDEDVSVDDGDKHAEAEAAVDRKFEDAAEGSRPLDQGDAVQSLAGSPKEIFEAEPKQELEIIEHNHEAQQVQEDSKVSGENIRPTPIDADENSTVEAQSPSQHEAPQDTESPLAKPPPMEQPSLFSPVFNLGGVNKEAVEVPHPVLLKDEIAAPSAASDSEPNYQAVAIDKLQPLVQGNIQLPTPDDTQVSHVKDSQDSSLVSGIPPMADGSEDSTSAIPIDLALENQVQSVEEKMVLDGKPAEGADEESLEPELTSKETDVIDQESKEENTEQAEQVEVIEEHKPIEHLEVPNEHSEVLPDNDSEDTQKATKLSPRRSPRIPKSASAHEEEIIRPSIPDNSVTQKQADEQTDVVSPVAILGKRTKHDGKDPSVEMAMSVLKSPPKPLHDLRSSPASPVDLKLSLSRALRSDLSVFTALKVLRFNLNKKIDVLAIVTSTPAEPQRAKGGPRHYQITFNITDSSIAPSGVTEVQVYRPYIEALPVVKAGDGILLRNFQVIAIKNRGFALRSEQNEASSWAVFKDGVAEPEIRGPPVEYGAAEEKHMAAMKEWFGTFDAVALAKLERANADKGAGKETGKAASV